MISDRLPGRMVGGLLVFWQRFRFPRSAFLGWVKLSLVEESWVGEVTQHLYSTLHTTRGASVDGEKRWLWLPGNIKTSDHWQNILLTRRQVPLSW